MLRTIAALLALSAATVRAEVVNDFETGTLEGWSYTTFSSPGGGSGQASIVAASGGGYELKITPSFNGTTTATRTINVSVPSALTFDYRIQFAAPYWGAPDVGYFLFPTSATLMGESYEHDPDDLPPFSPLPINPLYTLAGSKTILVDPGLYTMSAIVESSFTMLTGGGGTTLWLDNISIAPVPEPASFALALLAVLGLLGIRRRAN